MAHDGRVRPGVLCVYAYLAVFEDNKGDGLVKPPIGRQHDHGLPGLYQHGNPKATWAFLSAGTNGFFPPLTVLQVSKSQEGDSKGHIEH